MRSLADTITKIFNPFLAILATVLVVVLVQQIPVSEKILWLVLGFFVSVGPAAVLYVQYKKGEITSLWSPTAAQRQKSFLVWMVASAIFSGLAFWLGAPRLILALGLTFLALGLLNLLLIPILKISVHTQAITILVITSLLSVSIGAIYLIILILLVAWARLQLKAHDLSEVSLGSLSALLAVYIVFSFFGLATF
ncbi:hypothetical protein IH981_01255 [Patescibacteria group bacterium]|nr:hypothetical protein [Patescibacteria group bacterium]